MQHLVILKCLASTPASKGTPVYESKFEEDLYQLRRDKLKQIAASDKTRAQNLKKTQTQ